VEAIMFATTKVYSGFSVDDLAAARQFYGATLGIRVSEDNGLHDGPPIAWFTDPASNVCPVLQLAQRALAEVPWMDRRGRFVAGEHAGGRAQPAAAATTRTMSSGGSGRRDATMTAARVH
jgi:catechol 2,3-dioxygenase-like lactoylglutathione lyase family enzyme